MALALPTSLTPSKVAAFKDCALAFRFSVIDGLPEPPSPPAVKGTLVHRTLQLLMELPAPTRTREAARECLARARADLAAAADAEFAGLELDAEAEAAFVAEADDLVDRYFELEDPTRIHPVGLELRLEVQVGSLTLRGIIDRLEVDDGGGLIVTDYKTGKPPGVIGEQNRLGGVHFYAYLCEQVYRRPTRIQLLYLSEPVAIAAYPSEQSIRGLQQRTRAIWQAVERACDRDDFRPRPSRLCEWCGYQAYCPAFGGDPALVRAATEADAEAEVDVEVDVAAPVLVAAGLPATGG